MTRKLKLIAQRFAILNIQRGNDFYMRINRTINIFLIDSKIPRFYLFILRYIDKRNMLKKDERASSESITNTIYINSMKNNESTDNKGNFIGR